MKLTVLCFIFLVGCTKVVFTTSKACSLPLHGEWEKYSPILLLNNASFIFPDISGGIKLHSKQNITVVCPDPKNYLTFTNSNQSYAICDNESSLKLYNKKIDFEELQCKKVIRGTVVPTTEVCGDGQGYIYQIGYKLTKRAFTALIKVCYNANEGDVLFTEHLLHGSYVKDFSKTNYRPSFSPQGIDSDIPVSLAYKQVYQKSTFNKLLGSAVLSSKYINSKSYLARGHLSPDADFLFAAWQYTTYYYINTSPQWQTINAGNWKKIEFLIRKTAEAYNRTFEIITGNYDILRLPDINNNNIEIYLASGSKLPVSKYVWKIVYSRQLKKAVAIIILNNPFVSKITEKDLLCNNICDVIGWDVDSWLNYSRGFVHCCDYNEFSKVVKTIPKLAVKGVLDGIN